MYWFDCDMPNTFVCTGVFNNERNKVGDYMTNYSEFKNLNKNQVKLLTILEQEFPDYDCYDDEDWNWELIAARGTFYDDFICLCECIVSWYIRRIDKHERKFDAWPEGFNSVDHVLNTILSRYQTNLEQEIKTYCAHERFFRHVHFQNANRYGE